MFYKNYYITVDGRLFSQDTPSSSLVYLESSIDIGGGNQPLTLIKGPGFSVIFKSVNFQPPSENFDWADFYPF